MKQIKTGNVIACEYIALGSHAKYTAVNIYTGNILVREFPAIIPLAFYIEIVTEPSLPKEIKFQIFQNKKLMAELGAEFEYEEGRIGLAVLPQLPYSISQDTNVRVVVSCPGYKPTTILSKKISVGPIPPG